MTPESAPLTERVQSSFQHLAVCASHLNAASDELTKPIQELDANLKELNLGISAWVIIYRDEAESGEYWYTEEIGYTKINNKWGIALRTCSGEYSYPPAGSSSEWLFSDAPRELRIKAIEHIPALLDELAGQAQTTASQIKAKTEVAQQLAAAAKGTSPKPASKRK